MTKPSGKPGQAPHIPEMRLDLSSNPTVTAINP